MIQKQFSSFNRWIAHSFKLSSLTLQVHNVQCHHYRETRTTTPTKEILPLSTFSSGNPQFLVINLKHQKISQLFLFRVWEVQKDDVVWLFLKHRRYLWTLPWHERHIHRWVYLLVYSKIWWKFCRMKKNHWRFSSIKTDQKVCTVFYQNWHLCTFWK